VNALFRRTVVYGLGLLGGSVALAARRRGAADQVVGVTRRSDVLENALRGGIVDVAEPDPVEAARGADFLVLATPVYAMGELVERIAPVLEEGAVVTDVGSVKGLLAETLPGLLPRGVHYVGSHPMAGSHHRGFDHAREDLFDGARCAVTTDAEPAARERVAEFWRVLGSEVVWRDAVAHDTDVAWTSHVPHAVAFAFAAALEEAPASSFELRGSGFRDFTRIAASDPELWADILRSNRKALAAPLQAASRALSRLSRLLDEEDGEALERFLADARAALSRGEEVRSADLASRLPEPPTASEPGGIKE